MHFVNTCYYEHTLCISNVKKINSLIIYTVFYLKNFNIDLFDNK